MQSLGSIVTAAAVTFVFGPRKSLFHLRSGGRSRQAATLDLPRNFGLQTASRTSNSHITTPGCSALLTFRKLGLFFGNRKLVANQHAGRSSESATTQRLVSVYHGGQLLLLGFDQHHFGLHHVALRE